MNHFTHKDLIASAVAQERGIDNKPPWEIEARLDFTIAGLERVRAALDDQPILISSGYRCPALNQTVGGSKTSQHMQGEAADFTCPAFGDPQKVVERLMGLRRLLGIDQLILERSWVHISFTLNPRYQVLRDGGSGKFESLV